MVRSVRTFSGPPAAGEGRLRRALAVVLLYIDRGRPHFVRTLVIVLCGFLCGSRSVETREFKLWSSEPLFGLKVGW